MNDEIKKNINLKNDKKTKTILGKPHEAMLISKVYNYWNLRHGVNQDQIQINYMLKN